MQAFATNVTVVTDGIAAHGIVAQSVGGGGGLIRVADKSDDSPALTTSWNGTDLSLNQGSGNGGSVNVYVGGGGGVAVSGAGAIGVLAQSIGGGGGLAINDNSMFAGSSIAAFPDCIGTCGSGGGVEVWVDVGSTVSATGESGIGIFAQSQGYGQNGQISVTVSGEVIGGSGTAATLTQSGASGIRLDGGSSNQ
ncbi:hypothetical protein AB4144_34825, partial [Rhizobiaceae sp. 2RAB30]